MLPGHLATCAETQDAKRAAWLVSGAWRHPSLPAGMRDALAGELPAAPLSSIATPAGIYTPAAGELGEPRPFDSKVDGFQACTASSPADDAVLFERAVFDWCGGDGAMANWLQRFLGRAIIGRSHRRALNIIGPAGCGKSVFTLALSRPLGRLAQTPDDSLFNPKGNHNQQLADVIEHRPRLLLLLEMQERAVDATLLNQISGGDHLEARRPREKFVRGTVVDAADFSGRRCVQTQRNLRRNVRTIARRAVQPSTKYQPRPRRRSAESGQPLLPGGAAVAARRRGILATRRRRRDTGERARDYQSHPS